MKFRDHIGLDIGSKSIKILQLNPLSEGKFKMLTYVQADIPVIANEQEAEMEKVNIIKKLFKDSRASSRQVVIGLPESQVYTRVIEMPYLEEAELAQAIRWQAEQYIPVPLADVVLKHQIISKNENLENSASGKMTVLLIAAPNLLLKNLTNLISRAGLETIAIETEILAVARSLVGSDPYSPTTLIIHMGSDTTTLSIISKSELALTQSVSSGGAAITRAVSSSLNLDINQAEEYKKTYGLDDSKVEGKVAGAIKPLIELILTEVKRVLAFYDSHGSRDQVRRVVLSGGTALLPGLVQYLTSSLNIEVQMGNPFLQIELTEKQKTEIGENDPLYSTVVGLAQKLT